MTSKKRLADLEMLQDFIQSATTELIWLNEKEEIEISRDWSSKSLNVTEIERYYEVRYCSGCCYCCCSLAVSLFGATDRSYDSPGPITLGAPFRAHTYQREKKTRLGKKRKELVPLQAWRFMLFDRLPTSIVETKGNPGDGSYFLPSGILIL